MDTAASKTTSQRDAIQTVAGKIKGIRVAMLTTVDEDGTLKSRPMATQDTEFDGTLWFFTKASAPKVGDVERDQQVSVAYAKPSDELYVALSGAAHIVRDREKMKSLWNPLLKAWFPQGQDDPDLALLEVTIQTAEYWDSPSRLVTFSLIAKNALTSSQQPVGEDRKLTINP